MQDFEGWSEVDIFELFLKDCQLDRILVIYGFIVDK